MKHPLLKYFVCFLLLFSTSSFADIFLPRLVSDGVVLQRETENKLWGWANNGESVSVKLNGKQVASATTNAGTWELTLPEQKAGGPYTLEFIGNNTVRLNNVYFGDVWLASGQSNMEYPLNRIKYRFPDEIPQANNPQIRYFRAPKAYDFNKAKKDYRGGSWKAVTPQTAGEMSAVSWFFAKNVHRKHKVPIGIIDTSYGGSTAESWFSEDALAETYPHYLEAVKPFKSKSYLKSLIDEDQRNTKAWWDYVNSNDPGLLNKPAWFDRNLRIKNWPKMKVPSFWADQGLGDFNGVVWFRKEIILPQSFSVNPGMLELGRIVDADAAWINGIKLGETGYLYPRRQYPFKNGTLRPGKNSITVRVINSSGKGGFVAGKPYILHVGNTNMDLSGDWQYQIAVKARAIAPTKFKNWEQPLGFYNAMLAPVLKTSFKGILWYQGESNINKPEEYRSLFPDLIRHWRREFNQGDLPFVFVQLPNHGKPVQEVEFGNWTLMRAAQAEALEISNTAMAVTYDVGEWNDIHPLDKKTVGERVALAARKLVYKEKSLVASGPSVASMKIKGNKVRLVFENVGSGIMLKGDEETVTPGGFSIAGEDGKYVWAQTKLKKKYMEVWSDAVKTPKKIRYAWADNPVNANFYNKEGLPAAPFEIDVIEEE